MSENPDTNKKLIYDIRREQEQFQEEQQRQMNTLLEALKPIRDLNQIIKDVSTLRQDTNLLLEANSNPSQKNNWDTPQNINQHDHQSEVINKLRSQLSIHEKMASSNQRDVPRVMKLKVDEHLKHQPSSDDESDNEEAPRYRGDSVDDEILSRVPFYSRENGTRHPGLTVDVLSVHPLLVS